MSLKVFTTSDFPSERGGCITAVIVANNEDEARFLLEKDLKNDNVAITDRFGIQLVYTMQTNKMYRTSVDILSYGDEL